MLPIFMNFPILLLSNYRTGSSSLVRILGEKYGLEVYSEPHLEPRNLYKLESRIQQGSTNMIIKFMPDYIDIVPAYKTIYNSNCYKIKLTRRDKVAQVVSYYVASTTGMWNNYKNIDMDPYTVGVENDLIDNAINTIFNVENLLSQADCDEEMVYEDMDFSDSPIMKITSPDNYKMLYSHVESRIKSKML